MKRSKRKWLAVFFLFAVIAAAAYLMAQKMEQKRTAARETEREQDRGTPEGMEEQREVFGTVCLGGKTYSWSHDIETILFIGTDAGGQEDAKPGDYRGSMADALMLLVVDRTGHTVSVLQLDRDTMTEVGLMQEDGSAMATATVQLCTAHWYGGTREQSCENTADAVSKLLGGLKIDAYYALGMEEIPVINHSVGGVSVVIESDFSEVDPALKRGKTITLTDEQAYTFIHDRYGVDDGENRSRMKRQRQYLSCFIEKCRERMCGDKDFIIRLYQDLSGGAVTSLTGKMFSRLTKEAHTYKNCGVYTIEGSVREGRALGDGVLHSEFYPDREAVLDVMKQLYGLEET